MELHNYTQDWVWDALDEVLKTKQDICDCKQCRYDMAAMALNRLKPHYVVNRHGSVYAKSKMLSQQQRTDVLAEVLKAVEHVSKNPHHMKED